MVHTTSGLRDPAAAFPLPRTRDDTQDRRLANRAVAVSALGLAATGLIELFLAVITGSVGLLGDAIHNLSDVSTSAVVFLGFRLSRRLPTERYPYGLERAEDLAGIGIALVIWISAAFAGAESVRKFLEHGQTAHVGAGIVGALIGIVGNQVVARYKLAVGRRIGSATLIADARHSWLDALSSLGRPGSRTAGHGLHLPRRLPGHRQCSAPPGRRRGSRRHQHCRGRCRISTWGDSRARPSPVDRPYPPRRD
jgi:divalent metal cation (Fe/Co/Zn/Cd) transporter